MDNAPAETEPQQTSPVPYSRFELRTVSIIAVNKAVKALADTAGGNDQMPPPQLLKMALPAVASTVTFIINNSILSSTVTERWKEAVLIPVYKTGDRDEPRNYRPVCLSPSVAKVTENIVLQQLTDHLETKRLITDCQFGFKKGRSTEMTLLSITESMLGEMDIQTVSLLCLLYLSKASGCVPCTQQATFSTGKCIWSA